MGSDLNPTRNQNNNPYMKMETLYETGIEVYNKEPMSSIIVDQNLSIASIKMAPTVPYT